MSRSGATEAPRTDTVTIKPIPYRARADNGESSTSLGTILVIILIIFLLGGFSGRFGGYGYGFGHAGTGILGAILIIVVNLMLLGRM